MLQIISEDKENQYKIFKYQYIVDQQKFFIEDIEIALKTFYNFFNTNDYTWNYKFYNTFCITSASLLFYNLFSTLKFIIRDFVGDQRPLWVQSWINYHQYNELLDWHNHYWPYHGYICIDPKDSQTVFENYNIKNEIGNIYIGRGYKKHKVICNDNFTKSRITIGFDVLESTLTIPTVNTNQFSLIPI